MIGNVAEMILREEQMVFLLRLLTNADEIEENDENENLLLGIRLGLEGAIREYQQRKERKLDLLKRPRSITMDQEKGD